MLAIAYATCIGRRPNQEDCVLAGDVILQEPGGVVHAAAVDGESLLAAACDGMGGHAGGEWASRFACGRLAALGPPRDLPGAGALARRIQEEAERQAPDAGCGTTLAAVAVHGNRVVAFGAGDSRVYKIAPWGIASLLRDHSLVRELADRGVITGEEARRHPHRNVITLGVGPAFREAWAGARAEVAAESLGVGECLLLCTDGVHDLLGEEGLLEVLGDRPPQRAAALAERLRAEASDNASFVLISRA